MEMEYLRWILLGAAIIIVVGVYFFSRARKKDQYSSPLDAANDVPSFSAAQETTDNDWLHGVGPVRVVSDSQFEPAEEVIETKVDVYDKVEITEETNPVTSAELEAEPTKKPIPEPIVEPVKEITEEQAAVDIMVEKTPDEEPVVDEPESEKIDDVISVYVLAPQGELINGEKVLSASYALHMEYGAMKIFHRHDQDSARKIQFSMANIQQPGWFDIDHMHDLKTTGVSFFMQVNLVDKPSAVLDEMMITAHSLSTMIGATLCNAQRKPLDEAFTNDLREKVKRLESLKSQTV